MDIYAQHEHTRYLSIHLSYPGASEERQNEPLRVEYGTRIEFLLPPGRIAKGFAEGRILARDKGGRVYGPGAELWYSTRVTLEETFAGKLPKAEGTVLISARVEHYRKVEPAVMAAGCSPFLCTDARDLDLLVEQELLPSSGSGRVFAFHEPECDAALVSAWRSLGIEKIGLLVGPDIPPRRQTTMAVSAASFAVVLEEPMRAVHLQFVRSVAPDPAGAVEACADLWHVHRYATQELRSPLTYYNLEFEMPENASRLGRDVGPNGICVKERALQQFEHVRRVNQWRSASRLTLEEVQGSYLRANALQTPGVFAAEGA